MTKYTVIRTVTNVMYQTVDASSPQNAEYIAKDLWDWELHEMISEEYEAWEEK